MVRKVVEVIHCDGCGNVQESAEHIFQHILQWDDVRRKIEFCIDCQEGLQRGDFTFAELCELGVPDTPIHDKNKREQIAKKDDRARPAKYPRGYLDKYKNEAGMYACPGTDEVGDCKRTFPMPQNLSKHFSSAHPDQSL